MIGTTPVPMPPPGDLGEACGLYRDYSDYSGISYEVWCAEGAGGNYVNVIGGTTYYLNVYGTRNSYEIYYGEDIEKGKPIVTFTKNDNYFPSSGGCVVSVNISSEVELNLEESYYALVGEGPSASIVPKDEASWDEMINTESWMAVEQYTDNIPSLTFTASPIYYGDTEFLRLKLVDINGNCYYYICDIGITYRKYVVENPSGKFL